MIEHQQRIVSVLVGDTTRMNTDLLAAAIERKPNFKIVRSMASDAHLMEIASELRPDVAVISAGLGTTRAKAARSLVNCVRPHPPPTPSC